MNQLKFSSLPEMLTQQAELKSALIQDFVNMLNTEINRKKGASGLFIKGGFKVVKNLDNGKKLDNLIERLLPDFLQSLDPYYQNYRQLDLAECGPFSEYLASHSDDVANALLSVTDKRRQQSSNKILLKTYDQLRPAAVKNIAESTHAIGQVLEKHLV